MPNLEKQTLSLRDGFNFKQFRELTNPSNLCTLLLQLPEFLEFESKWVRFAQGGAKDERSNTRMIEGVGLRDCVFMVKIGMAICDFVLNLELGFMGNVFDMC